MPFILCFLTTKAFAPFLYSLCKVAVVCSGFFLVLFQCPFGSVPYLFTTSQHRCPTVRVAIPQRVPYMNSFRNTLNSVKDFRKILTLCQIIQIESLK